eukprot:6354664-Pyramimonas_sp.AAC.1
MESLKPLSSLILPAGVVVAVDVLHRPRSRGLTAISMDLCDPPVTRIARASESLDGCPVFAWSCIAADLSARSSAAVSTGYCAAVAAGTALLLALRAAGRASRRGRRL